MIKLTDWIAAIPPEDKYIAYVGENESVTRQFFLPELSYREHTFYLDMAFDLSTVTTEAPPRTIQSTQQSTTETVNADGTLVTATANTSKESYTDETVTVNCAATTDIAPLAMLVREDGLELTWTVLSQQTQLPGTLRATLRAVGPNGEVKKSAMMAFIVSPSVTAAPASPILLTEHEQMERAMVEAFEQAAQDKMDEMIADAKEWADNVNGVYVGSGDMPDAAVIQIDPTGEAMDMKDWVRSDALLDMVYPVGSIYLSVNAADPSALFGGTWERLRDRFLLAAGDSYAAGATGGEASHTLTVAEMPSHRHSIATASSSDLTNTEKTIVAQRTYAWSHEYSNGLPDVNGSTGGGQAHNNMPPYLAVYMWKRIA